MILQNVIATGKMRVCPYSECAVLRHVFCCRGLCCGSAESKPDLTSDLVFMGGTCGIDDYLAGIQPGILPHLFKAGENVFMPAAKGNTGTKLDVALQHGYQARRCTATRVRHRTRWLGL